MSFSIFEGFAVFKPESLDFISKAVSDHCVLHCFLKTIARTSWREAVSNRSSQAWSRIFGTFEKTGPGLKRSGCLTPNRRVQPNFQKQGDMCEIAYPTLFSNRSSLAIFQFWGVLNRYLFLWTQRKLAGPNFEQPHQELTGQGISI